MDRILEGLRDGRRQNNISAFLATTSLTLLCLSTLITPRTVAWNLLLLISMTSGIGLSIHSILTTFYVRLQADSMPLLIHYAPTHHPTQLGSPLGELLFAHLDPDSQIEWSSWEERFTSSILPGIDPFRPENVSFTFFIFMQQMLFHQNMSSDLFVISCHQRR